MSWRDDYRRVRALCNSRDGHIDRHINRPVSALVTLALLRTRITPNQVTLAAGLLGLAAGAVIAHGGREMPVIGAFMFQLSVILDCVDGELARLKQQFSRWGEWLDIVTDTVATVAVFIGIAVAVARMCGRESLYVAGALLVGANVITFPLVTHLERRVFPTASSPLPAMRRLELFVRTLSGRDVSMVVLLAALFGRLDWFLWAAAVGAHVFWIVVLGLWYAAIRERDAAVYGCRAGVATVRRRSQRSMTRPMTP
jgi:1L-myo-inositol 1-phosphate cytidylyltransferase / CDP-L-myo-inositol myo-inositolphosphotransferase